MIKNKERKKFSINNSAGFLAADFLFSFVLVISCGIIIFALTFSLATVEISQYIVWSSARAYSAANLKIGESEAAGKNKFNKLSAKYPLLTGVGSDSPWFELKILNIGDAASAGLSQVKIKNELSGENRHPWTGVSATVFLKLFSSLKFPFLGNIANDKSVFTFPIRTFILRNPSQQECLNFFKEENRFNKGIQQLESTNSFWKTLSPPNSYVPIEDNGC